MTVGVYLLVSVFLIGGPPALSGQEKNTSLQERVERAEEGDEIHLEEGRYEGPLVLDSPLKLRGTGSDEVIIDGQREGHTLLITANQVLVEDLTVRNSGRSLSEDHAGIRVEGDDVTIRDVRVKESLHGIYIRETSGAKLIRNQISSVPAAGSESTDSGGTDQGGHNDHQGDRGEDRGDDGHEGDHAPVREDRGNGIHFYHSRGATVRGNRITRVRDGVYFSFTSGTQIVNNRIDRTRYGLHYMYSDQNEFHGNHFTRNAAGAAVMYSRNLVIRDNTFHQNRGFRAWGLLLQDVEDSVIEKNAFTSNRAGLRLQNSYRNEFRYNRISGNQKGVRLESNSRRNLFSRNVFGPNNVNFAFSGEPPVTVWSEDGKGNYWASGRVMDLTGDGTGNLPHYEWDVLGSQREEFPPITLLDTSPGNQLLKGAYQRVPAPGAYVIEDPNPLAEIPDQVPR